jgi:nucleoside-diphosphate-sugar epimerase
MASPTSLVIGASGNTGKHVVQFLLDQGQRVKVICRDKNKMLQLLEPKEYHDRLDITERPIAQVSVAELQELTSDCTAVISCVGHNATLAGIWGSQDRWLVRDTVAKLTEAMPPSAKFVLMGSEGVAVPGDDQRSLFDRILLFLIRHLVPPHADNEAAAAHVLSLSEPEWCIVRPTDLQEGPPQKYVIHPQPFGPLFASGIVTRSTVARFIVDLVTDSDKWATCSFKAPCIHDSIETSKSK